MTYGYFVGGPLNGELHKFCGDYFEAAVYPPLEEVFRSQKADTLLPTPTRVVYVPDGGHPLLTLRLGVPVLRMVPKGSIRSDGRLSNPRMN